MCELLDEDGSVRNKEVRRASGSEVRFRDIDPVERRKLIAFVKGMLTVHPQ